MIEVQIFLLQSVVIDRHLIHLLEGQPEIEIESWRITQKVYARTKLGVVSTSGGINNFPLQVSFVLKIHNNWQKIYWKFWRKYSCQLNIERKKEIKKYAYP